MPSVRQPAVAGMFYPDDPRELRGMVSQYLAAAETAGGVPKAIIAPHAGYIYSGPVAASAYALLKAARGAISRVMLLGPAHRVAFSGLALPSSDFFATPLGDVPIDREAVAALKNLPQGDASAAQVGEVLERLWGGPETLIVISSDLSHYHDYQTARRMDAATSRAIESLRFEDLDFDAACGRVPVSGLLYVARQRGLSIRTLDLRNSGDTAGPRDQVVGYGAYAIN
ncbi:MAG: dioxygenase [Acidithiobacillales bacterium SM23_46]|nr:MAG: dioxygenase [Acidithiobacillales bacterium SM23_46]